MPKPKASGLVRSKYGAGGSRQRKINAQAKRAAVGTSTTKPKTGFDYFNDIIMKKNP